MPVEADLLEILVCPETRQPVRLADEALIARLNEQIRAGSLRTRGGDKVEQPITEALVREDGRVVYVVDDSIPVMLIEEAIEIA